MELPPTISMKSPNDSTVTGPEEANGEVDIEKRGDKKKGREMTRLICYWKQTLQASKSMNAPNGMKSASDK
jgi:hypothetical protein